MARLNAQDVISVLNLLVTLAALLVGVWVTTGIYASGANPPKQIEVVQPVFADVLKDIQVLGGRSEVLVDGHSMKRLLTGSASIGNVGLAPILPADFAEPLSMKVKAPWKLIGVEKDGLSLAGSWERLNDTEFRLAPTLMNPGDRFAVRVYVTTESAEEDGKPMIEWSARVVNMKAIQFASAPNYMMVRDLFTSPVVVLLYGRSLFWLIIIAPLLHMWLLAEFHRQGWVTTIRKDFVRVALLGLWSFSVAEAAVTVLLPSILTELMGLSWINVVIVAAHLLLVVFVKTRPKWVARVLQL